MTATVQQPPTPGQHLVLYEVPWANYLRLGRLMADRRLRRDVSGAVAWPTPLHLLCWA